MKTIAFKVKPKSPDEWVQGAPRAAGPMKRFTIDVPSELHSRIKMECARRQLKMADVLRELFEREFPKS